MAQTEVRDCKDKDFSTALPFQPKPVYAGHRTWGKPKPKLRIQLPCNLFVIDSKSDNQSYVVAFYDGESVQLIEYQDSEHPGRARATHRRSPTSRLRTSARCRRTSVPLGYERMFIKRMLA
ncbi:hypothetical protein TRAPUB_8576 [Trametes pubescens]|uniref:Uncharacterized protein n=1 Tax=Trametes pubescens TaxID=154538 RepID=A0A1M2W525_TRAPU|nr:hypothetical protein TRAPUB_8576 [Trametes pubescens]